MVKRGIGAIVLAIIAALLLGYLLKDKSRERQEVVDMKLPGAPELTIPSLTGDVTETLEKAKDGAATIIEDTKDSISNASNAIVDSATGTMNTIGDSASNAIQATKDAAQSLTENTPSTASNSSNPGFSFRPPSQNEEKEIVDNTNTRQTENTENVDNSNTNDQKETVVASTTDNEKTFKPTIEETPPPTKKKVVIKPATPQVSKPEIKPTRSASTSSDKGKYAIQLLATSSQSRANKLAETMTSEGYLAFITQTQRDNKLLYRVRIGGHKDRASAIKAQEGMKRRYQKNFFVQNSLVVSN